MWIVQYEPNGEIFADSYLHNECTYIKHWESKEAWLKQIKEEKEC